MPPLRTILSKSPTESVKKRIEILDCRLSDKNWLRFNCSYTRRAYKLANIGTLPNKTATSDRTPT